MAPVLSDVVARSVFTAEFAIRLLRLARADGLLSADVARRAGIREDRFAALFTGVADDISAAEFERLINAVPRVCAVWLTKQQPPSAPKVH